MEPNSELKLPLSIGSRVDVARVLRELSSLDDYLTQAAVRTPGTPMQLPKLSASLDGLARENDCNLLEEASRSGLKEKLERAISKAPAVHVSFAVEPSSKALQAIVLWFRQNIHPQVLVQVGLQPNMAVGIVVRTPNRIFDMSMREFLKKQEPYLTQMIKEMARAK